MPKISKKRAVGFRRRLSTRGLLIARPEFAEWTEEIVERGIKHNVCCTVCLFTGTRLDRTSSILKKIEDHTVHLVLHNCYQAVHLATYQQYMPSTQTPMSDCNLYSLSYNGLTTVADGSVTVTPR